MPKPNKKHGKTKYAKSVRPTIPAPAEEAKEPEPESYLPREFDPSYLEVDVSAETDDDDVPAGDSTRVFDSARAFAELRDKIEGYQPGGWLRLRHEEDWRNVTGVLPECCRVDLDDLAEAMRTVPLHERLGVPSELVSEFEKRVWIDEAARAAEGRKGRAGKSDRFEFLASFADVGPLEPAPKWFPDAKPRKWNFVGNVAEHVGSVLDAENAMKLDLDDLAASFQRLGALETLNVPQELVTDELRELLAPVRRDEADEERLEDQSAVPEEVQEAAEGSVKLNTDAEELQDWLDDLLA